MHRGAPRCSGEGHGRSCLHLVLATSSCATRSVWLAGARGGLVVRARSNLSPSLRATSRSRPYTRRWRSRSISSRSASISSRLASAMRGVSSERLRGICEETRYKLLRSDTGSVCGALSCSLGSISDALLIRGPRVRVPDGAHQLRDRAWSRWAKIRLSKHLFSRARRPAARS